MKRILRNYATNRTTAHKFIAPFQTNEEKKKSARLS